MLNGVFDPAPAHPLVPYGYLLVLLGAVVATAALAATAGGRWLGRFDSAGLRDL